MDSTKPLVRMALLIVGVAVVALGALLVLTTVLNPDWWKALIDGEDFRGGNIVSRAFWWLQSLTQGLQVMVWGLIAMGLGHLLRSDPEVQKPNPLPPPVGQPGV